VQPNSEGSSTEKVHVNPEIPDRVVRIHQYLQENGYIDQMQKLEVQGMEEIEELIAKIHSRDLINLVRTSCEKLGDGESSSACNPG